jgi:hypothetical protein
VPLQQLYTEIFPSLNIRLKKKSKQSVRAMVMRLNSRLLLSGSFAHYCETPESLDATDAWLPQFFISQDNLIRNQKIYRLEAFLHDNPDRMEDEDVKIGWETRETDT